MKPTSRQGGFNSVSGQREHPNQWPRTYASIQYSNRGRPNLQKKSRKKSSNVGTISKPAKKSRDRAKHIKIQNPHNNSINSNINLDLGFSEINDRITVPNPLNPSTTVFAENSMNQIASNLNVKRPMSPISTIKTPYNLLQTDLKMNWPIPLNSETSMRIRSPEIPESS